MIITDYKRNHSQKTTVSLKYSIWPRLNFSVSFSFFSNYQWKWDYSLFLEDINLQIMYENMLFIYACLHISTIGDICFTIVWWSQSIIHETRKIQRIGIRLVRLCCGFPTMKEKCIGLFIVNIFIYINLPILFVNVLQF